MTLPGFHECPEECQDGWQDCGNGLYEHRCPVCGGAGQVPDDDTVEAAARALFDMTKPMQPGSQVPPFGSFLTDNVYRHQARAALLAYARHTQETKP